jgi:Na+/proline symporter
VGLDDGWDLRRDHHRLAARNKDLLKIDEYLVAGRSFSGFLLFFLAVGEIYSIGTMVGLPGGIYAEGAGYGVWFVGYILLAYPVGYFLAPLVWRAGQRYNAMTFPDMLKGHYRNRLLEVVVGIAAVASVGGVSNVFDNAAKANPTSLNIASGEAMTFALTTIVFQVLGFITLTTPFIFTGRSEATLKAPTSRCRSTC